ncbi:MAG: peptide deformylase [Acidobacteria bacterium]|nr:peptide deformylase [Acidobacteriota bacterium]
MIRRIVKYGEPVLETPAQPVKEFGPELETLVADMFESMYANKGVGLAAPQVGVSQRVAIVDVSAGEDPEKPFVLVNPEIVHKSGSQRGEEGCLSIPGFREEVTRAAHVRIKAQNVKGEWFEMEGTELVARAILHERDHLDGILFLQHLSPLKRELIKRKIKKLIKAGEWE